MGKRIERFIPSWFSVIMGTGILPIALMLASKWVPIYKPLAKGFFILSIVLFFIILVPWLLRFFMYPKAVKKDLFHPILGSFFPTMPISLLTLSVGFLTVGEHISFIGKPLAIQLATWLFIAGTIGIILLGLIILPIMFTGESIDLQHANFGWFIPPVSHLFITIVGLDLIKYYPKSSAADSLFLVSMIALGIGIMLFIFVGAAVYHRYTYHELPASSIASTFFIGMVPTAKVAIISVKAYGALAFTNYNFNMDVVHTLMKLTAIISWGFSIWWFVLAIIVLLEKIIKNDLPFALSWWAFAFPIGALAVSTGAINKIMPNIMFPIILQILIVIFLLVWVTTLINTLIGIKNGSLFKQH
ncbi:MAG: hypothetical protein B6I28_04205 [Fusobacteriia bacterium 4572_132]|nr:MAG: hypothetical protein B6I28_04205 [Fusobacteriia bacterium 4572_132]